MNLGADLPSVAVSPDTAHRLLFNEMLRRRETRLLDALATVPYALAWRPLRGKHGAPLVFAVRWGFA